jgi:hypothetical protein
VAGSRIPGCLGLGGQQELVDDGTLPLQVSPKPGPVCPARTTEPAIRLRSASRSTPSLPFLRQPDIGHNVEKLQSFLNFRLNSRVPLRVDGYFGPRTRKAVVDFQAAKSIKVDGEVGKITWYHLITASSNGTGTPSTPQPPVPAWRPPPDSVLHWSFPEKLGYVVGKFPAKTSYKSRTQFAGLVPSRSLTTMLVGIANSMLFGVDRRSDHGSIAPLGGQIFRELGHSIKIAVLATTKPELDRAAASLAQEIEKTGIAALLGVLAKFPLADAGGATETELEAPPAKPPAAAKPPVPPPPPPPPTPAKRVIQIEWVQAETWCSEGADIRGTTENYGDGESLPIVVDPATGGKQITHFDEKIASNAFSHHWEVLEVLPPKMGQSYVERLDLNGHGGGQTTPKVLLLHFIPNVPKTHYQASYSHFDLSAHGYLIKIESEIHYVKGWAGQVVKLGPAVPGTAGLLDGHLSFSGYRWMKSQGTGKKYWDGTAWQDLPAGFVLIDANNFAVGFYKTGTTFTCQYGGTWPEAFADWNINAADKQAKIQKWKDNIHATWTAKFDLKRKECRSREPNCCRYSTTASVQFTLETNFAAGMLVIADGNIRSNDSLWFTGESRIAMAAHEFGHHLGNPDEYAGSALDTSLNDDGATAGIDANSIMGQNLTKVKKRHYRTICSHFSSMVKTNFGKTYTYEAVAVSGSALGKSSGP